MRRAGKRARAFLTLAGVVKPPNAAELERTVDDVVMRATANKEMIEAKRAAGGLPGIETMRCVGEAVLGLNQGADQICEVYLRPTEYGDGRTKSYDINAFDRAGFLVMSASLRHWGPGDLFVETLSASHGRNCSDFKLEEGRAKVPGRGNALPVAAGLESIVVEGVKAGLHRITTSPASVSVAHLYQKMGFRQLGSREPLESPEAQSLMSLDLTDRELVHQALVTFGLGRSTIIDVPKDIAARLAADGAPAPEPLDRSKLEALDGAELLTAEALDPATG